MERVDKVTAFVTRDTAAGRQVLVFRHPLGSPDSSPFDPPGPHTVGIQLPAGTVERGESPESAVLREVREETGLGRVEVVRKLGSISGVDTSQVVLVAPVVIGVVPLTRGVAVDKADQRAREVLVDFGGERRWVPHALVTTDVVRHFFHLRTTGATQERWTQSADGWDFECYWTPVGADAGLVRGQDRWLDLVRTELLQDVP